MMSGDKLIIEGGQRLKGTVRISGAKNAVLPCMAACLLTTEDCYLENVPNIGDVGFMAKVLESLGARVEKPTSSSLLINASNLTSYSPPTELVLHQRASFLVLGALLGRLGRGACSFPGGDVIGQRPVDVHLSGFAALGANIEPEGEKITAEAETLHGARIFLDYPSVLGTENVMLAAVLAKGTSVIINAAAEPEVMGLADMLNSMGARITGAGSSMITIEGSTELHGTRYRVIPDRIEAGTFVVAAAITKSDVEIADAEPSHMDAIVCKLREAGVSIETGEGSLRVTGTEDLRAVSVQALPYPGLATDLQAPIAALLTQAEGVSYVHERVFDNRLLYVSELRKLGAEVVSTGTTAVIAGPRVLTGNNVRALDVRAGAALVLAGLIAHGQTEVADIYHLDRGYERLEHKLQWLGANIERIPG
jgi:UDP-N-acetylglucosamine 1-carboxyvinyltransferase